LFLFVVLSWVWIGCRGRRGGEGRVCAMEGTDYSGKIFVGGISWETDEDRLRDYFGRFGEVTEAVIMRERSTGRARGFGFVVFSNPADAERVTMDKHMIDGRMVIACCNSLSFCLSADVVNVQLWWEFCCKDVFPLYELNCPSVIH
jgi:hypothetical protein